MLQAVMKVALILSSQNGKHINSFVILCNKHKNNLAISNWNIHELYIPIYIFPLLFILHFFFMFWCRESWYPDRERGTFATKAERKIVLILFPMLRPTNWLSVTFVDSNIRFPLFYWKIFGALTTGEIPSL